MSAEIYDLGAHENMTVEEAISQSSREDWSEIMIIGYIDGHFVTRSSHMTRKEALWLAEFAKQHILGWLDD